MDYRYPRQLVPADGQALVEQMDRFVERRGEPMLSVFSPEEFAVRMKRAGSRLARGAGEALPAGTP